MGPGSLGSDPLPEPEALQQSDVDRAQQDDSTEREHDRQQERQHA
jgi:hypothetical protein